MTPQTFSLILDAFGSLVALVFGVWLAVIALGPKANLPLLRLDGPILRVPLGSTGRVITMVLAAFLLAGGVRALLKL